MTDQIEFTPKLKAEIDKMLKMFFKNPQAKEVKKASINREETIKSFKRIFERSIFKKHPVLLEYVLKKVPDFV